MAGSVIFSQLVQCANSQSQNRVYTYRCDCARDASTIAYRFGSIAEHGFGVFNPVTQIIQISHVFDINNRMVKVTGAAQ